MEKLSAFPDSFSKFGKAEHRFNLLIHSLENIRLLVIGPYQGCVISGKLAPNRDHFNEKLGFKWKNDAKWRGKLQPGWQESSVKNCFPSYRRCTLISPILA